MTFASASAPLAASALDGLIRCPWSLLVEAALVEATEAESEAIVTATGRAWRAEPGGAVAARTLDLDEAFGSTFAPKKRKRAKSLRARKKKGPNK